MDEEKYQVDVRQLHDKLSLLLSGTQLDIAVHALGVLMWDLASDESNFEGKVTVEERIENVVNSLRDIMTFCAQADEEDERENESKSKVN